VVGADCEIGERAHLDGAIVWPGSAVGADARLTGAVIGRDCRLGAHVEIGHGAMIGDHSVVTDYSRTHS
jgi:NDP-sugar pyrophosphorylase family protein